MAIITSAEAKALLQISASTYDTLIATLIPLVQAEIVQKTNNAFLLIEDRISATTIAFVSGSPATITDTDAGFVEAGISSGCDILVDGSKENDGIYNVQIAVAGTLTLATGETLVDEVLGEDVVITKVKWPKGIKLDAAHIINYFLTKQGKLVNSESLPGGYSVNFKSDDEVWSVLNKYRKPYR